MATGLLTSMREAAEMFGFVTDEDRARWAREDAEDAKRAAQHKPAVGDVMDEVVREQRQASRIARESSRPRVETKTTTTTTHIQSEEDLGIDYW